MVITFRETPTTPNRYAKPTIEQKGTRVMQCEVCGRYHFYKKDFLTGWKLVKVSKVHSDG